MVRRVCFVHLEEVVQLLGDLGVVGFLLSGSVLVVRHVRGFVRDLGALNCFALMENLVDCGRGDRVRQEVVVHQVFGWVGP